MEDTLTEDIAIIQGFENYTINKETHEVINTETGYIMTPRNVHGYLYVGLNKNGKRTRVSIHRLLMIHFVPNPNNYPIIHHKDDNPLNNNLDNLEWCTYEYNTKQSYKSGTRKKAKLKGVPNKLILNTETGIYYISMQDVIRVLPYRTSYKKLNRKLSGEIENDTPFTYV